MASQIVSDSASGTNSCTEIVSFVRGYHEYKDIWQPVVGEILILKKEPTNVSDRLAVCIQKDGQIVGHMPRNLAPLIYYFLVRDINKGMAEITGMPLNRGAGMGMEVPCIYRLYGPEVYITRLQDMVKKDIDSMKLRHQVSEL